MLMPKKVKHRKWHKGRIRGKATSGDKVSFGAFGMKSMGSKWISARQIEAARKVISRYVQKNGKIWIRIFPDKPVTAKGAEVPMGKGKGAVDHYVAVVKSGMILFEMEGVDQHTAQRAIKLASYKLPVKTKFVTKL